MYRWLLPPKLIIASLLSSDWIIFWHHHHSHILGSMAVIIILKVNFRWKGGDIEIIYVWKSKVWAASTHIFLAYYENFWGKCILYLCALILFFSFFLGPFFGLCGVLLFTTHTCIDARLYTYSQDGLLMLTTVWFKPNVKCLLCLEHLHRRFWMSRHQGQSFIL